MPAREEVLDTGPYVDREDFLDTIPFASPISTRKSTLRRSLPYVASFAGGVLVTTLALQQGNVPQAADIPPATTTIEATPPVTLENSDDTPPRPSTTPTPTPDTAAPRHRGPIDIAQLFSADSYWNTPLDALGPAPIDADNSAFVADSERHSPQGMLFNTSEKWGQPIFFGDADDPVYTLEAATGPIQVHIPADAKPASGSDGQMVVFDQTTGFNRAVGMHGATFANGQWSTDSKVDNWQLDSNGLPEAYGGDPQNGGHRGVPAPARAILYSELTSTIDRRLECFWHATGEAHYFPMTGAESGKGGIVPEGIVARINPGTNLDDFDLTPAERIIATALQEYGCVVGDNSGSRNRIKIQVTGGDLSGMISEDGLKEIPWSEYQFVQRGYDPTTGKVRN